MNVNALLSEVAPANMNNHTYEYSATSTPYHNNGTLMTPKSLSPNSDCKNVHFRFCNSEPKTLHIYPHDTTDSITTTVKNMFGLKLQDEFGLSFQDPEGRYMILRHENFSNDMTVDIRVEENPASYQQYNLRHSQAMFYTGLGPRGSFADGRSVSPSAARGRRSASAGGRSKGMKRQASHRGEEEFYDERSPQGFYLQQPPQQFLPEGDEESESRSRIEPVASADISLDNIVEGSRRKRPKFSADELPLFPPPALTRNESSAASSASPPHPAPLVTTPYGNRNISYPHPTPPSTFGFSATNSGGQPTDTYRQVRANGSTIPTPAPTVASCISDEDVALQLMRLGEVPSGSATASTLDETMREEDGFSSECGEFGDDGRSDTAELPELPPRSLGEIPGSPIMYPRNHTKYKSLDEILPSFDSTVPSDDECSPLTETRAQPPQPLAPLALQQQQPQQQQYQREVQVQQRVKQEPYFHEAHHTATDEEDFEDHFDDEADETYVGKEEEEDDDGEYDEEDLDDIPLKTLRGRKASSVPSSAPVMGQGAALGPKPLPQSTPLPQYPKGMVKAVKRQQPTTTLSGKPKSKPKPRSEPHWPISPASPPASRKPSVASVASNKARPSTVAATISTTTTATTTAIATTVNAHSPTVLFGQQTATPVDENKFHTQYFHDDKLVAAEDAVVKPRCQRCRKSKKGCDRQRPCQRCKDAGIPAGECISEDEAGTRRGRQAAAAAAKKAAGGGLAGLNKNKAKGKRKRV